MRLLVTKSARAEAIQGVTAREALSAGGFPALEVTVTTIRGDFVASCAIGPFDGDESRFGGRGLIKSVDSVMNLIADKVVGRELNQQQIDAFLSAEPNVPENVVLAVSMAVARAAAKHKVDKASHPRLPKH